MRVLIVYAHPEPKSFNGQLKSAAVEQLESDGHTVEVSDLYASGFNPVEGPEHFVERQDPDFFNAQSEQRYAWTIGATSRDVKAEVDRLFQADFVIFQYPMWWYGMPAILKGWLDRVLVYGGLYTSQIRYDRGHFKGRRAMLSITTGGPAETFAHNGRNADIDLLLWPANFTLHYMGFSVLPPFVAHEVGGGIAYSDQDAYESRLSAYRNEFCARLSTVEETEPMSFNGWEDWDGEGRLKRGAPHYSPFIRSEP